MVVFFGAFAVVIVLAVVLLSGKMTLLPSPDGKTVYELRVRDGRLQHALRHGGVQLFSWSDIVLTDASGREIRPSKVGVSRNNSKTGEFEIDAFPGGPKFFVRVTDTFVASKFFDIPGGKMTERVEVRPEAGAKSTQFPAESIAGFDEKSVARPFVFIAPKADGRETFLVYHHTEAPTASGARPTFIYDFKDLSDGKAFAAETRYENDKNGLLHVLYFSDSGALLREIYGKGMPEIPFPTLQPDAAASH